ncbi:MAG: hypothetical protein R3D60_06065 [Paracoccaceae bacterium]
MANFLNDQSGAVTVDFVVLAAAVVGFGAAAVTAVASGQNSLGRDIRDALQRATVAGASVMQDITFSNYDGLIRTGWGYLARGSYDGWTANGVDRSFELIASGYAGVTNPGGGGMLDMGGSPGNLSMSRTIEGVGTGNPVNITVSAADIVGNNQVNVLFGGEVVGTIDASRSMREFTFQARGGMGDGSNTLTLSETGRRDNVGTYIGGVSIR